MTDNLRDALENLATTHSGSDGYVMTHVLEKMLAAHPVEPAPGASRERAVDVLVDLLQEANRRDIAALERQGWPGIPEVPDYDMRVHCGHLVGALLAAGVFREPQAQCGAVDRTGQRRCVFTPGHHEVENWTSHGDRGGWTWNDRPARLPKSGAELSAASIAVHRAKRQACLDYGIGHHDCSEHGGG